MAAWGVEGTPVLLVAQNDITSVIAIHGALRAGAVLLVAPVSAGRAQLAAIIDQANPVAALAPDLALGGDALPGARPVWQPLGLLGRGDPPSGASAFDPRSADEPSVVIYTSGTTSRPKGVIHSLGTLLAATRNFIDCAELHGEERLFVVSPLASITGMLQSITVPAMLGARVVLETKWDAAATCDLLLESGGTFFGGPDLLLDRLLDEVEARGRTRTTIGAVYLGGAMLDPRILNRIEEQFGIVVMRAYGSSEAPISTASCRSEPREIRLADDGAPLVGVEVRRGSQNDPAECCITGPHLFLGYADEGDDAHAFETDRDGRDWFCTGDVADLSGGRVKVVGRIRDIVIRKGLKVPISEVEGLLNRLPGIARSAGYATADPETGERLAVAVLPADGVTIDFDAVIAGLRAEGLATWKLPEELVLWDEPFPENATGKVLRNRLEAESVGRPRVVAPRLREEVIG
jgi:acyl-CoA synthetase (AMP-forming)/AMP-acid ligase II